MWGRAEEGMGRVWKWGDTGCGLIPVGLDFSVGDSCLLQAPILLCFVVSSWIDWVE